MKRLFFCAGLALTMGLLSSCAQHDTKSPDTSGSVPYNQPGVGVDTARTTTTNQAPNHSNDGTNNNQTVNTGDTGTQKQ